MLAIARKFATVSALAIAVLTFGVTRADAAMQLTLDTGTAVQTITDGGAGDSCAAEGCITYVGLLGGWTMNFTTGLSKPIVGPAVLTLNSVDVATTSGGTLTISLTDTGFISPVLADSGVNLTQRLTGLTLPDNTTVTAQGYVGTSNQAFGQDYTSGAAQVNTANPFASVTGAPITASNLTTPYSMTEVVQIAFGGPGVVQFSADLALNPEPTALVLFGTTLFMVVRTLRRRSHRA